MTLAAGCCAAEPKIAPNGFEEMLSARAMRPPWPRCASASESKLAQRLRHAQVGKPPGQTRCDLFLGDLVLRTDINCLAEAGARTA